MNGLAELQISKDDPTLFNVVYRKYRPLLCDYAKGYVPFSADAEDLVTEVFIRLLDKTRSFNNAIALRAFLYTSVYHACVSWSIQKGREDRRWENLRIFLSHDREEYVLNRLIRKEIHRELTAALELISVQPRKVCKMLYYEGLTLSEVAVQMNLSKNTVKNHQARGLKILRAQLNKGRLCQ